MKRGRARIAVDRAFSGAFTRLPLLGRLWARVASVRTSAGVIPWTPFATPLAACRAALITTGGVHLAHEAPFEMRAPPGDPTFREVPTHHWSFMGHIDGPLVRTLETVSIPALLQRLHGDRPDFVLLVPA